MTSEVWGISETPRFGMDLLHFSVPEAQVRQWRRNLERDPMIGEPNGTGSHYDYDTGRLIVRYLLVPQQRHVVLMVLLCRDDVRPSIGAQAEELWRRLIELAALWSGIRWW